MPLKRQEQFCRDEFDAWLRKRDPNARIVWQDEPNDPPDFWLELDGQRYAVEVTRIINQQERGDIAALWRLVDEAESEALQAGELIGTYIVVFNGHIDNLSKVRNSLKARLREFVRSTSTRNRVRLTPIDIKGRVLCSIEKLSLHRSVLAAAGGVDNSGGWEGEICQELCTILQRSLAAKSAIVSKSDDPTIVILYDLFGLATRKQFIKCLQGIPETRMFHMIYVVEDIGRSYIAQESPFIPRPAHNKSGT
jgi:hypothetical protein